MKYGWLLSLLMGLAFLIGGGWLAVYELQHPPTHSGHLYVFIGIALLGALLINPAPILSSVKQVVVIILPIIPWSKAQQAAQRLSGSTPAVPDDPETKDPRP